MGFGLFGKLPQKRDFVSFGISHSVLGPLETWLQSAVAASRAELGRDWEKSYLVAPIWRFWMGRDVLGAACAGALMPSVDGVGRYFPLLAIYVCAPTEHMPPPPFAPQSDWFAAIESRLLSTLDGDSAVSGDALLQDLPLPFLEREARLGGAVELKGGTMWQGQPNSSLAALLTAVVEPDYRFASRVRTYWWTGSNETRGPILFTRVGMPDPYFYTVMIKSMAD